MTTPLLSLNTGAQMPAVQLGLWQSEPGQVKAAVLHALRVGYRAFDGAFMYQNERELGEALREAFEAGICSRADVFVTSKLWCTFHRTPEEALNKSLQNLGLDYLDLYLMHWPVPMNPKGTPALVPRHPDGSRDLDTSWSYTQTWAEMEKLPNTGKTKAIGVSNLSVLYLQELLKTAKIVPATNQIENHPLLPQQDVKDLCDARGIILQAYSPLGSTGSPLFQNETVKAIAEKYGVSPSCVLISYHVNRKNCVLPKSVTPSRIGENLKTVELGREDLDALSGISQKLGLKRFVYPDFGVDLAFPDKSAAAAAFSN